MRMIWDYTHLHANPVRALPMILQITDRCYVRILGALLPGRSDKQEGGIHPLLNVFIGVLVIPGFPMPTRD